MRLLRRMSAFTPSLAASVQRPDRACCRLPLERLTLGYYFLHEKAKTTAAEIAGQLGLVSVDAIDLADLDHILDNLEAEAEAEIEMVSLRNVLSAKEGDSCAPTSCWLATRP